MKNMPKLLRFSIFGFGFKFGAQAKVKGEIKTVGLSEVNFANSQIIFEFITSGDHEGHI